MLDEVTKLLFADSYPREIGKKRNLVRNLREFEHQIDLINGVDEVFTNVNPLNGVINKIFFDLDDPLRCNICHAKGITVEGHMDVISEHFRTNHPQEYESNNKRIDRFVTQLPLSLGEAQQLYTYLINKNIPTFHIASGKKGIHLYSKFQNRDGDDNRAILYKTTKSLLLGCFGADEKGVIKSRCIDTHLVGNTRALCRIAGTMRPPSNSTFCTFLPPHKGFLEMTLEDLRWYIKSKHTYSLKDYDYDPYNLPRFEDFILPELEKVQFSIEPQDNTCTPTNVESWMLKELLRPCLYRLITVGEPRHHVRIPVVVDLKRADFTTPEIVAMLRPLKWVDWSEDYTIYQINNVKPIYWPRKTMLKKGICFKCGRCD